MGDMKKYIQEDIRGYGRGYVRGGEWFFLARCLLEVNVFFLP